MVPAKAPFSKTIAAGVRLYIRHGKGFAGPASLVSRRNGSCRSFRTTFSGLFLTVLGILLRLTGKTDGATLVTSENSKDTRGGLSGGEVWGHIKFPFRRQSFLERLTV